MYCPFVFIPLFSNTSHCGTPEGLLSLAVGMGRKYFTYHLWVGYIMLWENNVLCSFYIDCLNLGFSQSKFNFTVISVILYIESGRSTLCMCTIILHTCNFMRDADLLSICLPIHVHAKSRLTGHLWLTVIKVLVWYGNSKCSCTIS